MEESKKMSNLIKGKIVHILATINGAVNPTEDGVDEAMDERLMKVIWLS